MGHFEVGQRGLVAETDLFLSVAELSDGLSQRLAKLLIAPLKEILRFREEELQVVLPDAETVAKLVWTRGGAAITSDMPGHVDERLAGDLEHLLPTRFGDECRFRLGGRAVRRVEGISDAERHDLLDAEPLNFAKDGPTPCRSPGTQER